MPRERTHALGQVRERWRMGSEARGLVMVMALVAARMTGKVGFVGVQSGDLVLDGTALVGKTVVGILEGGADPQTFIPRMVELWQAGKFPFDRLIETFPLAQINEAEQASLSGRVLKPVLIP